MHRLLALIALSFLCAPSANALDLPARKPGLWELKMAGVGNNQSLTMGQCIDAATDKLMNSLSGGVERENCSKAEIKKSGSTIVVDSVCTVAGATVTSHGEITGDFSSAYTVKVTSTREGGSTPARTSNVTIDAKWESACKPDQKPGDIILPGGIKINILELQQRLQKGAPKKK